MDMYVRWPESAVQGAVLHIHGSSTHVYSSLQECALLCAANVDCAGFVDNRVSTPAVCVFKTSVAVMQTRFNKDLYVKQQKKAPAREKPTAVGARHPGTGFEKARLRLEAAHACASVRDGASQHLLPMPAFRAAHVSGDLPAHQREISRQLSRFRDYAHPLHYASYHGPRLEDHFLTNFGDEPHKRFAPFVPLFAHWSWAQDHAPQPGKGSMAELVALLNATLRHDVFYVAVTAAPLESLVRELRRFPNMLVFSSKGDAQPASAMRGMFPIPHLFSPQEAGFDVTGTPQQIRTVVGATGSLISNPLELMRFVGNPATHSIRKVMHARLSEEFPSNYSASFITSSSRCAKPDEPNESVPCWRQAMLEAHIALCPRGSAPATYRMYEALQMGLIPVYLWDEIAWLPYCGTRADVRQIGGAALHLTPHVHDTRGGWADDDELAHFARQVPLLGSSDFAKLHAAVLQLRDSHFTAVAVMAQLRAFLDSPSTSDLKCWDQQRCVLPVAGEANMEASQGSSDQGLPPKSPKARPGCDEPWSAIDAVVVTSKQSTRSLVLRVPDGTSSGIADHLTGLISAFALALSLRRTFRVDWPALEAAFYSPREAGSGLFLNASERSRLSVAISHLNGDDDSSLAFHDWLPMGGEVVNGELLLGVRNARRLNRTFAANTVVVQSRQGMLGRAFAATSKNTIRTTLQRLGLSAENAFSCLYHYLLVPRPDALAPFESIRTAMQQASLSFGLHIRTGDESIGRINADGTDLHSVEREDGLFGLEAPMWDGYTRKPTGATSAFIECAKTLEAAVSKQQGVPPDSLITWYVASDSAEMAQLAASALTTTSRKAYPSPVSAPLHTSAWVHWKAQHNKPMWMNEAKLPRDQVIEFEASARSALISAARDSFMDQFMLGEATAGHVVGEFSGFGRLGHALAMSSLPQPMPRLVHSSGSCLAVNFAGISGHGAGL